MGISNILKTVHHLLKLRASNKRIKQMLLLLFLNFRNFIVLALHIFENIQKNLSACFPFILNII